MNTDNENVLFTYNIELAHLKNIPLSFLFSSK